MFCASEYFFPVSHFAFPCCPLSILRCGASVFHLLNFVFQFPPFRFTIYDMKHYVPEHLANLKNETQVAE